MIEIVRFADASTFVPKGHEGVLNRALTSREMHGVDQVGVWHGSFDAGGAAGVHVHDQSAQVYVVLGGEFLIGDGVQEWRLGVHDTAIIPAGQPHSIRTTDAPGTVLVISAPTLR